MKNITYDDILFVFKTDVDFRRKTLTILFVEDFEDNYPKYNKELEKYFYYEACSLKKLPVVINYCNRKKVDQEMLNAGLARSADANDFDVAYYLITEGADISSNRYHVIKKAISENEIGFLRKMKKMNFDFSVCEEDFFKIALADENLDAIKFLIDEGLGNQKYIDQAFKIALSDRNKKMIKLLESKGATPDCCKYEYIKYIYS